MNFQKELELILDKEENKGKKLFLHSCCAPCSSYVLDYLRNFFRITVFYFNPNITEDEEYKKRVEEQKRLIDAMNLRLTDVKDKAYLIEYVEGEYCPNTFFQTIRGNEACPEGGKRCEKCFRLRLEETAKRAKAGQYDYFTTTLTISPLKNAKVLNEIGMQLEKEIGTAWLPSDFKKKNGYQCSIQLSAQYDLYRQDYCGCIYSKIERNKRNGMEI